MKLSRPSELSDSRFCQSRRRFRPRLPELLVEMEAAAAVAAAVLEAEMEEAEMGVVEADSVVDSVVAMEAVVEVADTGAVVLAATELHSIQIYIQIDFVSLIFFHIASFIYLFHCRALAQVN
jgi:hypothetical protein